MPGLAPDGSKELWHSPPKCLSGVFHPESFLTFNGHEICGLSLVHKRWFRLMIDVVEALQRIEKSAAGSQPRRIRIENVVGCNYRSELRYRFTTVAPLDMDGLQLFPALCSR